MADRYYTDPEYRKVVDDYLTGPRKFSKSKGAFRKFVKEEKAATVDTSSLAQKIKKEVKAKCTQKTNYNIHYRQQQLTIPILQNWQINNWKCFRK